AFILLISRPNIPAIAALHTWIAVNGVVLAGGKLTGDALFNLATSGEMKGWLVGALLLATSFE
ncbi:hypothetical protein, partial [Escherichia albertii]|uniref:hypothetical protein n=1 Tax=Escherichia albertii TaxID=208962 RepID=UPI001659A39C